MEKIKSCGVFVYRGEPIESFLLMRHPARLDLPKGHVDPGESELECALRELREETGILPEDISLDPNFRYSTTYHVKSQRHGNKVFDKTLVIFLGRLVRPVEIQLTEHAGYEWVPWSPPHRIQAQTIDPLLAAVERHW